jgi:hypothetical protein
VAEKQAGILPLHFLAKTNVVAEKQASILPLHFLAKINELPIQFMVCREVH